jgi:hypothetical protein
MKTYKVRVVLDHKEEQEIFRDIAVSEKNSLEDMHHAIIKAFQFEGLEIASFYKSDEAWNKNEEFPLMDMGFDEEEKVKLMHAVKFKDIALDTKNLLYVYDFIRLWIFYVTIVEEIPAEHGVVYPVLLYSFGEAPSEDSRGNFQAKKTTKTTQKSNSINNKGTMFTEELDDFEEIYDEDEFDDLDFEDDDDEDDDLDDDFGDDDFDDEELAEEE